MINKYSFDDATRKGGAGLDVVMHAAKQPEEAVVMHHMDAAAAARTKSSMDAAAAGVCAR